MGEALDRLLIKLSAPSLTFDIKDGTWRGLPSGKRWIKAFLDGEEAGAIGWMHDPSQKVQGESSFRAGEIIDISVREKFRRHGVATALLREAKKNDPNVHHSTALSDDAKAWIKGMAKRDGDGDGYVDDGKPTQRKK